MHHPKSKISTSSERRSYDGTDFDLLREEVLCD